MRPDTPKQDGKHPQPFNMVNTLLQILPSEGDQHEGKQEGWISGGKFLIMYGNIQVIAKLYHIPYPFSHLYFCRETL